MNSEDAKGTKMNLEGRKAEKGTETSPAKIRCVRAFIVAVTDWPEATAIVRTVSPARAKFLSWNSANEVGYKLPFGRFKVKRAPIYDSVEALTPGKCYALDYAEGLFT